MYTAITLTVAIALSALLIILSFKQSDTAFLRCLRPLSSSFAEYDFSDLCSVTDSYTLSTGV